MTEMTVKRIRPLYAHARTRERGNANQRHFRHVCRFSGLLRPIGRARAASERPFDEFRARPFEFQPRPFDFDYRRRVKKMLFRLMNSGFADFFSKAPLLISAPGEKNLRVRPCPVSGPSRAELSPRPPIRWSGGPPQKIPSSKGLLPVWVVHAQNREIERKSWDGLS